MASATCGRALSSRGPSTSTTKVGMHSCCGNAAACKLRSLLSCAMCICCQPCPLVPSAALLSKATKQLAAIYKKAAGRWRVSAADPASFSTGYAGLKPVPRPYKKVRRPPRGKAVKQATVAISPGSRSLLQSTGGHQGAHMCTATTQLQPATVVDRPICRVDLQVSATAQMLVFTSRTGCLAITEQPDFQDVTGAVPPSLIASSLEAAFLTWYTAAGPVRAATIRLPGSCAPWLRSF